ncbi:hypothetical protein MFS40622_1821 [Methanocaldococcus sp. FS406-22]|uniref:hypothetical protein n=1 Tax=Methanocaldococcus sp. (strain FS406-22) TaxID=644281 RepID=UPI0001BF2F74|nr:hypothetical protein [Methanocaldococcus sp. FS406-22]ADC70491.1 hypothetical protein MFS40622_1821 [Methanocaldococcus sp. FS406-22]
MISNKEINSFISFVQSSKNPSKLFSIPYLSIYSGRNSNIRFGTRHVFADFPRIANECLYVEIRHICNEKFKDAVNIAPKTINELNHKINKIKSTIDDINKEKTDENTQIGFISKNLEEIGIKWRIRYEPYYKTPVIIIDAKRYYKEFWPEKIKNFIEKLNNGYDYPHQIYEMASELTPRYERLDLDVKPPEIFEVLENCGLSLSKELTEIQKLIEKLKKIIVIPTESIELFELKVFVDSTFADMLNLLYQLRHIANNGQYFSGYLLLRKLLVDIGAILFMYSLSREYPKIVELNFLSEEEKNKLFYVGIKYYIENFENIWFRPFYDERGVVILAPLRYDKEDKKTNHNITNYKVLKGTYKNRNFIKWLKEEKEDIDFKDTLFMETIDILRIHKLFVFDAIEQNITLPDKKEEKLNNPSYKAYIEYHKLSNAVHNPILVDFPPFSSTIEYLGFLHHLKIVKEIISESYKNLKNIISIEKKK